MQVNHGLFFLNPSILLLTPLDVRLLVLIAISLTSVYYLFKNEKHNYIVNF